MPARPQLTLDTPIWRILPSACRRASSPRDSLKRHLRVNGMQLVEIDPRNSQIVAGCLRTRRADARDDASRPQLPGPEPREPALGRDHEARRIGMQSLGDDLLADTFGP